MRFEGRPGFGSAKRSWATGILWQGLFLQACGEPASGFFPCLSPKSPSNHKYPTQHQRFLPLSRCHHCALAQQTIHSAVWRIYGTVTMPSLRAIDMCASWFSAMSSSYLPLQMFPFIRALSVYCGPIDLIEYGFVGSQAPHLDY